MHASCDLTGNFFLANPLGHRLTRLPNLVIPQTKIAVRFRIAGMASRDRAGRHAPRIEPPIAAGIGLQSTLTLSDHKPRRTIA